MAGGAGGTETNNETASPPSRAFYSTRHRGGGNAACQSTCTSRPLQQGWTIAKLRGKHASQPPNPDIANAFFRAGMIESWGLGIEKMRQACLNRRMPAPKLREEAEGLWIEFGFPVSAETRVQTPVQTRVETPVQILAYLEKNPTASLAETAVAVGKSVSAVERASSKLIKERRLRFVGPRKNGRWKVLK